MQKSLLVISDRALQKMNEIRIKEVVAESSWHLALVRTHCMGGRGYTYSLALETPTPGDRRLAQVGAIDVYVPESDLSRLSGSEIGYIESFQQEGFVVKNPNANTKCPCGHHDMFD